MKFDEVTSQIKELLKIADQHINEALALADHWGVGFSYRPKGAGYYIGVLTYKRALELIETGDYADLDDETKGRVDDIIASGNDEDQDMNYDCWESSFC